MGPRHINVYVDEILKTKNKKKKLMEFVPQKKKKMMEFKISGYTLWRILTPQVRRTKMA